MRGPHNGPPGITLFIEGFLHQLGASISKRDVV
jgi:hypothetical protein